MLHNAGESQDDEVHHLLLPLAALHPTSTMDRGFSDLYLAQRLGEAGIQFIGVLDHSIYAPLTTINSDDYPDGYPLGYDSEGRPICLIDCGDAYGTEVFSATSIVRHGARNLTGATKVIAVREPFSSRKKRQDSVAHFGSTALTRFVVPAALGSENETALENT